MCIMRSDYWHSNFIYLKLRYGINYCNVIDERPNLSIINSVLHVEQYFLAVISILLKRKFHASEFSRRSSVTYSFLSPPLPPPPTQKKKKINRPPMEWNIFCSLMYLQNFNAHFPVIIYLLYCYKLSQNDDNY